MKPIIPLKGGDEYDAFTRWRRVLKCFERAGIARKAKRAYNKRVRRELKPRITETGD